MLVNLGVVVVYLVRTRAGRARGRRSQGGRPWSGPNTPEGPGTPRLGREALSAAGMRRPDLGWMDPAQPARQGCQPAGVMASGQGSGLDKKRPTGGSGPNVAGGEAGYCYPGREAGERHGWRAEGQRQEACAEGTRPQFPSLIDWFVGYLFIGADQDRLDFCNLFHDRWRNYLIGEHLFQFGHLG